MASRNLMQDGKHMISCKIKKPLIKLDLHSSEDTVKLPCLCLMKLWESNGAQLIERPIISQMTDQNQLPIKKQLLEIVNLMHKCKILSYKELYQVDSRVMLNFLMRPHGSQR